MNILKLKKAELFRININLSTSHKLQTMKSRFSSSRPRSRRCTRRGSPSSSFRLLCNVKIVLIFLSLERLQESRAWTTTTTVSLQPSTSLGRRRRNSFSVSSSSTTSIRQTPIAAANDESATIATEITSDDNEEEVPIMPTAAWDILAGNVATCLIASDLKRASGMDGAATGWTSWADESSAFRLQQCFDRMVFDDNSNNDDDIGVDVDTTTISSSAIIRRDDTLRWLKWMKASPAPMVVELSEEIRTAVSKALTPEDYDRAGIQSQADFLSRIGCRLILLPSGQPLKDTIKSPPGAMAYGKLLYGGVTRYRILGAAYQG